MGVISPSRRGLTQPDARNALDALSYRPALVSALSLALSIVYGAAEGPGHEVVVGL
jgi:hypothetical protein